MTTLSIKRLIYVLLVTGISFFLTRYFSSPNLYWLILSTYLFSLLAFPGSFIKQWSYLWLLGLAVLLIAIIIKLLIPFPFFQIPIFLAIIWFCINSGENLPITFPFFILSLFTVLLFIFNPTLDFLSQSMILLGLLITSSLGWIFYLNYTRDEWQFTLSKLIARWQKLNNDIFACYVDSNYADNPYLFEKRLHVEKTVMDKIANKLSKITSSLPIKQKKDNRLPMILLGRIEEVQALLLFSAQLRMRVSDKTIFGLCKPELVAVNQAINQVLYQIKRSVFRANEVKINVDLTALNQSISAFEQSYHHVLVVSAREPLSFFLFLTNLKSLPAAMTSLIATIIEIKQAIGRKHHVLP